MVIFKTEVKHCRLEYAPSESILRAWFHQRHQANLNCVMGILIIGKYTPITASGDENLQTQIFESGDKRIRLVFNHNYCNNIIFITVLIEFRKIDIYGLHCQFKN